MPTLLHGYRLPLTSFGPNDKPSCDITDANGELVASVEWPAELTDSGTVRKEAAEALAALFAKAPRVEWILGQIIGSLPAKRDWLDPALEREARAVLAKVAAR